MLIKTPKYLVLVGTGNYYTKIIGPSLSLLQKEKHVEILATVSTSANGKISNTVEHRVRKPNTKLSQLLMDLKKYQPIVILGHTNELHTPDAQDLLQAGFTVFVEKPYAINQAQIRAMQKLARQYPKKLILLEYYLMMKAIPLLIVGGQIKTNSFYFKKNSLLKYYKNPYATVNQPEKLRGLITSLIGKPKFVLVDILEGEGLVGKVEHRGIALSDNTKGGGMIQDLGLHAMVPLFAMESYIGKIDQSFKQGAVRVAKCREYLKAIKSNYRLNSSKIAESYAEIRFSTSENVPVAVTVGKYLPDKTNQRRAIIIGTQGKIYFDLSSCVLHLARGEGAECPIIQHPKNIASKYYPVLNSALNIRAGKNPFTFNVTETVLGAQQFILNVLKKSHNNKNLIHSYKMGTPPHKI